MGGERDPGELLDRLLGDRGLRFDASFTPGWRRRGRRPGPGFGFGVGLAAAALLVAAAYGHGSGLPVALAPVETPAHHPVSARPTPWAQKGLTADTSLPAWTGTGTRALHETVYSGHASVDGAAASLIVALAGGQAPERALVFQGNRPLFYAVGKDPSAVAPPVALGREAGYWVPGGTSSLASFAAAGHDVYITHGSEWALLTGAMDVHWALDPESTAVQGQIAALPAAPTDVVLLTESSTGTEQLYVRSSPAATWRAEALPATPITQLVALGHQFWALANGVLYVSSDGTRWVPKYQPPAGFTVGTFAVGQQGAHTSVAVSLVPAGQAGVGPVLLSRDDGVTWTNLGLPWPNGTAPTQLVVTPTGAVGALLPGPPVLLELWQGPSDGWQVLSLPHPAAVAGTLTAFANGDLLYADQRGTLYRWVVARDGWLRLPRPPALGGRSPNLVMAIGSNQVLVSYPTGWWVLVLSPTP